MKAWRVGVIGTLLGASSIGLGQPTHVGWAQDALPAGSATTPVDLVEYVGPAAKQDVWTATVSYPVRGEVRQFDGEKLVMTEVDGASRTIPSAQIVLVIPQWRNEAAVEAHRLFTQKKYREVYAAVPAALQSGLAQWQQRLLIGELVQAVDALGNPRVAGSFFLNLAQSNPPALSYGDMPLCWTLREPDGELVKQATKWLESDDEAAQLLGASWLLFGQQPAKSSQILTRLQASKNSAIAQLAVAQSWRLVPPPQTLDHLDRWLLFRDHLIPPLQLGPTELIADRLQRIGETDLAIGQWIRIASGHSGKYHRAAEALELASVQLKRLDRAEEAQRLEPWIQELRGTAPAEESTPK